MRTDRQTNMTKLMVAFRNFANAPKNVKKLIAWGQLVAVASGLHLVWKPNGEKDRVNMALLYVPRTRHLNICTITHVLKKQYH